MKNHFFSFYQVQEKLEKEMKDMHANIKLSQSKAESEIEKMKGVLEAQEQRIKEVRGGMEMHKQEMKGMKDAINELSAALAQQKEEQKNIESNESLWSTIVGKHVEKKIETVTGEMLEVQKTIIGVKQQIDEEKDREKKRQNIIIYRAAESQASGPEARNREDVEFCRALVQDVLEIDCANGDIISVRRLGKREEGTYRPMLVSFKTAGVKSQVMESLAKLADAEDRYRSLSITHDMTQKEREEVKKLVAEAKEKQTNDPSGEYVYRVRGYPGEMTIVRLRKRQQQGGNSQQAGTE
jgi:hypothetical protein